MARILFFNGSHTDWMAKKIAFAVFDMLSHTGHKVVIEFMHSEYTIEIPQR